MSPLRGDALCQSEGHGAMTILNGYLYSKPTENRLSRVSSLDVDVDAGCSPAVCPIDGLFDDSHIMNLPGLNLARDNGPASLAARRATQHEGKQ